MACRVLPSLTARSEAPRLAGRRAPSAQLTTSATPPPKLASALTAQEAERILREVEIDDDAINLRGQFQNCRRVLLSRGTRGLAAAVVELKAQEKVFEIPILASARNLRQQGFGSVLVALLFEMAAGAGGKSEPPSPVEDAAPPACLEAAGAQAAATCPGAQPQQLGSVPRPQQLDSAGAPKTRILRV